MLIFSSFWFTNALTYFIICTFSHLLVSIQCILILLIMIKHSFLSNLSTIYIYVYSHFLTFNNILYLVHVTLFALHGTTINKIHNYKSQRNFSRAIPSLPTIEKSNFLLLISILPRRPLFTVSHFTVGSLASFLYLVK